VGGTEFRLKLVSTNGSIEKCTLKDEGAENDLGPGEGRLKQKKANDTPHTLLRPYHHRYDLEGMCSNLGYELRWRRDVHEEQSESEILGDCTNHVLILPR
jgi:hypothetical protein